MYVPKYFAANEVILLKLLENQGLAELITASPGGLIASQLPFIYEPRSGCDGALLGHLARANPHWQHPTIGDGLVIVRGPDSYISASWYPSRTKHGKVVPT